jgi:hypothetical protein
VATAICLAVAVQLGNVAVPRSAFPVNPIDSILEAFHSHRIVALGEGAHGNEQGHVFRLALILDPRFPTLANDIVVESGTAQYQDVLDRFVRGEDVPLAQLRHVWEDTTQASPIWDKPIYEEFFRTVRTINASLPLTRQLRVLLGDPPIDWQNIHSTADYFRLAPSRSDTYPVSVIKREVLDKHHRALVIYGDGHLVRQRGGIVAQLEKNYSQRVFSIVASTNGDAARIQPDVAGWPIPSLALLRGTRTYLINALRRITADAR